MKINIIALFSLLFHFNAYAQQYDIPFKKGEKLQYKITKEIYAEWDKLLQRDPFFEIVEKYWDDSIVGHTIEECKVSGEAIVSGEKVAVVKSLMLNKTIILSSSKRSL